MRRGQILVSFVVAVLCLGSNAYSKSDRPSQFQQRETFYAASSEHKLFQSATGTKEKVERFLTSLKSEGALPANAGFSKSETRKVGKFSCVDHQQTYKNRRIVGSQAQICFYPDGSVAKTSSSLCNGDCLRNEKRALRARSDWDSVAGMLMEDLLGIRFGDVIYVVGDYIWVENINDLGLIEAYEVDLETWNPYGIYVAYVDTTSGDLIAYEEKILYESGQADVYLRDPASTPELSRVDLTYLESKDRLSSKWWTIVNEDTKGRGASESSGVYSYDPTDTRHDEVQAHYGMERAMGRLLQWGYEPFGTIPIVVHYGNNFANAFYDGRQIALGDGDGTRLYDLAKDNTVVTHEYGHGIIDQVGHVKVIPFYGDGGAIHEGHADYFACATYNRAALGEGVIPGGKPLRRCDTEMKYEERQGEVHEAGQVWSAAMWSLRNALATSSSSNSRWLTANQADENPADLLSIHALLHLKSTGFLGTTSMMDMYRAVQAADQAVFGGAHEGIIASVFEKRGFPVNSGSGWGRKLDMASR